MLVRSIQSPGQKFHDRMSVLQRPAHKKGAGADGSYIDAVVAACCHIAMIESSCCVARCLVRVSAPRPSALRASRGCAVSRPFSHRFAAAGRADASMQMSRVVVLVRLDLPCWCFVAKRAKGQRFIRRQTTHHWLACMVVLYIDTVAATRSHNMIIFIVMMCFAVLRLRLHAEATCVACIAYQDSNICQMCICS